MHYASIRTTLPLACIASKPLLVYPASKLVFSLFFRYRIGDFKFGQLLECFGFNWYAVSVTDYPEQNYPHMKAIVENEVIGDNRLLRGEIMTITDIMRGRLRSKTLRPHIVAPVQSSPDGLHPRRLLIVLW